MADLSGYLCWTPEAAVSRISTEAVIPSSALFLATHTPLRISRARLVQRSLVDSEDPVDEHAVLAEFITRRTDSGALMMPLVGESGSGKSHLVRWVREHLNPGPHQKVIYLEKTKTSLKAVLESLLSDVEDPSLDSLKSEISVFSSSVDAAMLARRIVNSLNETLAGIPRTSAPAEVRGLVGPDGLAVVLQDPLFQGYLLKPGGFISQLAQQLLQDSGPEFSERSSGFTADDLPFKVRDVQHAAHKAQRLVGLINSKSRLQELSIGLLNEHLESALRSAANLAVGRLSDAFLKVRKVYAAQGREILLLIEDFALIQGVQRELLDALTEPAVREGEALLAPIRTLMAVTTGYFTDMLPETALTRIGAASGGRVFRLDVTFNEKTDEANQIASFTGRYLNVARVPAEDAPPTKAELTKNQCEGCQFRTQCHDIFGASPEGYGLYPFNRSALVRMVHSTADKPGAFVPRAVLGKVVRPILIDHAQSLRECKFPDSTARARFKLSPLDAALSTEVVTMIDQHDEAEPERYKFVVEQWGNAPNSLHAVDENLLRTLGLNPISVKQVNSFPASQKGQEKQVQPQQATVARREASTPASRDSAMIEAWAARGDVLDQRVASKIRSVINEAVLRRYLWLDPPTREWTKGELKGPWPVNSRVISIEGASEKIGESAPIVFERKAANSQFFQGLMRDRLRATDARKLATIAESNATHFASAIARQSETSDEQLITGMRALLLGTALAGRAWPGMAETDLLPVVLDSGRDWVRRDARSRTQAWREALERHLEARADLVHVMMTTLGVAQGTGEVRLIDAARALPLVRRAASDWRWQPESTPKWVRGVLGFSNFDNWATTQVFSLRSRLDAIRKFLPESVSGPGTVSTVRAALDEAPRVGLSPTREDGTRLRDLLDAVGEVDWRSVTSLASDLRKLDELEADPHKHRMSTLKVAAIDRGQHLDVALEFLIAADRWLTPSLAEATNRKSTEGDATARAVQDVLADWSTIGAEEGGS
ncbi:ATP-binding protein [Actinokineospora sp. PR83]|uniref:protein DpdH n=1 Tax=Actinokineospora sp. PR83 TaxID=2884908 RepID=UPI001F3818D8|nr:protein DpdH [Actinokineospora sp. PR83]MCG8917386.1 ATP-binding protein [Actinokineospora sp. PR83]